MALRPVVLSDLDDDLPGDPDPAPEPARTAPAFDAVTSLAEMAHTLRYQISRIPALQKIRRDLVDQAGLYQQECVELERRRGTLELTKLLYQKAADLVYEKSLGELEHTLNLALEYVFFDSRYKAKLDMGDRRSKTVDLYLVDESKDPPLEVDMRDGIGMGVRSVLSFVFQAQYLLARGLAPVMLIDEAYTAISDAYIGRFFDFVHGLCEAKGLALVLISHDFRVLQYVDKCYRVSEGTVSEISLQEAVISEGLVDPASGK